MKECGIKTNRSESYSDQMVKNDGVEVFEFVEQGKQCDSESQLARQIPCST